MQVYQELLRNFGVSLYDLLGVTPTAEVEEIEKGYLKLLPKQGSDEFQRQLSIAWEVLKEEKTRKEYDLFLFTARSYQKGWKGGHIWESFEREEKEERRRHVEER